MENKIRRFLKRKQVIRVLGDNYVLSELQYNRLQRCFLCHGQVKSFEEWFKTVAYMLLYNLSNVVGRVRRLKLLPASPSKYAFILRYGKSGIVQYNTAGSKRTAHFKNKLQYWLDEGYSMQVAQQKVGEIQKSRSLLSPVTTGGTSEYTCRSTVYWIKQGLTPEQAVAKVLKVQHRDKSPETIAKWLATLASKPLAEKQLINLKRGHSIESYIATGSSNEEAVVRSNAYYAKRNNASQSSQSFFILLDSLLQHDGVWYKYKNYERQFAGRCVDFYDAQSETVVEYYGDFWHRNPARYASDFFSYDKTSAEIWALDTNRIELITRHHLVKRVIIVWESDVMKNPHETALSIIEAIKYGN